ncbi:MAG: hypothetical protein IJI75_03435 [Solobacterium sp.]|nr:hypothetical protein [Solobacterium sp.]
MAQYEIVKPEKLSVKNAFNAAYSSTEACTAYGAPAPTDPSLTAWDAVMTGRFGKPDEAAMERLVGTDPKVKKLMISAYMTPPRVYRIEDDGSKTEVFGTEAAAALMVPEEPTFTAKGELEPSYSNFRYLYENDSFLSGIKGYNQFSETITFSGPVPWDQHKRPGTEWQDFDESGLAEYLEARYGIRQQSLMMDALLNHCRRRGYHEIREWIQEPVWDGTERISQWLVEYFGADDNAYVRAVSRKTLIAAIARVFEPGCKVDSVLTMISVKTHDEAGQGIGKSTFVRKLAGFGKWFSDTKLDFRDGKNPYEAIRGVWILEIGEGTLLSTADSNTAKNFLSAQSDRYRPAYGRASVTFPRQTVFIITSNDRNLLKDTENRRYWPVDCHANRRVKNPFEISDSEIRQMWAEAYVAYQAGEKWWLSSEEEKLAAEAQEAHQEAGGREGEIAAFVERRLPTNWAEMNLDQRRAFLSGKNDKHIEELGKVVPREVTMERQKVCAREILCELYGKNPGVIKKFESTDINKILDTLPGWEPEKSPTSYGPLYGNQRGYRRVAIKLSQEEEITDEDLPF